MEEEDYRTTYELEDANWWFVGMRRIGLAWLDRCLAERSAGGPHTILDVGCGTGRNLEDLRTRATAVGADLSPTALAFCRQRGLDDVVCARGERLPVPDASVSAVTAFGVIEHIEADGEALAEWARVLEPGGHVVVLTSAYQWLWSGHDVSNHHVRRYTAPEVRALLAAAGFEQIRVSYANLALLAPIAAARLVDRARRRGRPPTAHKDTGEVPELVNRALVGLLAAEDRWLARRDLPAGVSIIATGRAPLR